MDLAAEQMELCRKACFLASNIGYRCLVQEKDGKTRYCFQSVLGVNIEGEYHADKKVALESLCKQFNKTIKPNGT